MVTTIPRPTLDNMRKMLGKKAKRAAELEDVVLHELQ
jgi:hypothetical protein